jgi:hypothetical protein
MTGETAERDAPDVRKAIAAFHRHGGILRMADALQAGVLRRTLYAMRDAGRVEALARGLYRLTDAPPLSSPDLVTVAAKVPHGVVYLVSALAFHEMTTQIPHSRRWNRCPRNPIPRSQPTKVLSSMKIERLGRSTNVFESSWTRTWPANPSVANLARCRVISASPSGTLGRNANCRMRLIISPRGWVA